MAIFRFVRDTIFFATLVLLVKIASEKALIQMNDIAKNKLKSAPIHKVDANILELSQKTKNNIKNAIKNIQENQESHNGLQTSESEASKKNISHCLEALSALKKEVADIEKKLIKTAPTTFALGPIGSASIVLKENNIQKKLFEIQDQTNKLLSSLEIG